MKIKPNQKFLDGRDVYEKDQTYDVPPEKVKLFTSMGWIDGPTKEQEVKLDIQNVTIKTSIKKGGK